MGLHDITGELAPHAPRTWRTWPRGCGRSFADADVTSNPDSNTQVSMGMTFSSLAAHVTLDWHYSWSFASGSGSADASVSNGNAAITLHLASSDYAHAVPTSMAVAGCSCTLSLHLNQVNGGITGKVANYFRDSVSSKLQGLVQDQACDQLKGAGKDAINKLLVCRAAVSVSRIACMGVRPPRGRTAPPGDSWMPR